MRDIPLSERPRERLLREGPSDLQDVELVAILLGTGTRGTGVLAAAHALLAQFADLRRLASAGVAELCVVPGVGIAQACRLKAGLALAGRLGERPFSRGERLGCPRDVFERVGRRIASLEHEVFLAIALDTKHRVVGQHRVADGGVCSVEVLPRDVFTGVVREAAAAVIFVHNHPSGDPSPSTADEELTRRLTAAGVLVGVQVLDHVIVTNDGYYAFSEAKELRPGR